MILNLREGILISLYNLAPLLEKLHEDIYLQNALLPKIMDNNPIDIMEMVTKIINCKLLFVAIKSDTFHIPSIKGKMQP